MAGKWRKIVDGLATFNDLSNIKISAGISPNSVRLDEVSWQKWLRATNTRLHVTIKIAHSYACDWVVSNRRHLHNVEVSGFPHRNRPA